MVVPIAKKENMKKAKKLLVKALKMNPSNPDAKRELSRLAGGDGAKKKKPAPKKEREKRRLFWWVIRKEIMMLEVF